MQKFTRYAIVAVVALLIGGSVVHGDGGDITTTYKGGLVSASTTPTTVTVGSMRTAAFYFENQGAGTVVIKFGGGTAAYAGTSADYTNQLVLASGESRGLELFGVASFSVDASAAASLEWSAVGFTN